CSDFVSITIIIVLLKLALIAGLNGGILPGVNPGLTPGLTPGLVVGGRLAPAILTGGTGILGLPPIAQVVPGVSPFMMQPQVFPGAPVGFPNSLVPQPQQFPVLPPNGGMPFFGGFPQPGMLPPQQQVAVSIKSLREISFLKGYWYKCVFLCVCVCVCLYIYIIFYREF
uniref:Uncharacterized protein n=1 Tax=Denticeps clupeoides TaxID=299321 RepID=A0AAY4C353_9TELE